MGSSKESFFSPMMIACLLFSSLFCLCNKRRIGTKTLLKPSLKYKNRSSYSFFFFLSKYIFSLKLFYIIFFSNSTFIYKIKLIIFNPKFRELHNCALKVFSTFVKHEILFFPYNSIITLGEGEYKHLSIYNFFKGTLQNFFFFLRKGILQNLLSGFDLFVFFYVFIYIFIF